MSKLFSTQFSREGHVTIIHKRFRSLLFFAACVAAALSEANNPQLLHDPFKKPTNLLPVDQNQLTRPKVENRFLTQSKLTATLLAGKNSMAIVNGLPLKLGESIDGYRLLEVKDHSAVFSNNQQKHVLVIDNLDDDK